MSSSTPAETHPAQNAREREEDSMTSIQISNSRFAILFSVIDAEGHELRSELVQLSHQFIVIARLVTTLFREEHNRSPGFERGVLHIRQTFESLFPRRRQQFPLRNQLLAQPVEADLAVLDEDVLVAL